MLIPPVVTGLPRASRELLILGKSVSWTLFKNVLSVLQPRSKVNFAWRVESTWVVGWEGMIVCEPRGSVSSVLQLSDPRSQSWTSNWKVLRITQLMKGQVRTDVGWTTVKWASLCRVLRPSSPTGFSGPTLCLRSPGILNAMALQIEKYVSLSKLLPHFSHSSNSPVLGPYIDYRMWSFISVNAFSRVTLKNNWSRTLTVWWEVKSTSCLLFIPRTFPLDSRPCRGSPWCSTMMVMNNKKSDGPYAIRDQQRH